jgi:pimeloyl-ACP methyl ester carboxylesterase
MRREDRRRLRGGVFLSRVGAVLASAGVVRACLDLLSRGSTGVPRRVGRLFGAEASRVLTRLVGEVQKLPRDVWPAAQAHWSQAKSFRAMAAHLSALEPSAAEVEALGDLGDLPLAVITAASQSPAACAEHARIAALSSKGRQVICAEGGHWVHLDAPGLVVAAIREVVQAR